MRIELSTSVILGNIEFRQVTCTRYLKIVWCLDEVGASDSTCWYDTSAIPILSQQSKEKIQSAVSSSPRPIGTYPETPSDFDTFRVSDTVIRCGRGLNELISYQHR